MDDRLATKLCIIVFCTTISVSFPVSVPTADCRLIVQHILFPLPPFPWLSALATFSVSKHAWRVFVATFPKLKSLLRASPFLMPSPALIVVIAPALSRSSFTLPVWIRYSRPYSCFRRALALLTTRIPMWHPGSVPTRMPFPSCSHSHTLQL